MPLRHRIRPTTARFRSYSRFCKDSSRRLAGVMDSSGGVLLVTGWSSFEWRTAMKRRQFFGAATRCLGQVRWQCRLLAQSEPESRLAHDVGVPELAGYALRGRQAPMLAVRVGRNGREFHHRRVRGGRNRAAGADRRCGDVGLDRGGAHGVVLLLGQGPGVAAADDDAVRAQLAGDERLVLLRRRQRPRQ